MFYILFYLIIILCNNLLLNTQKLPFDTLVNFGDGNTDTGNVYNLTNHQWPLVPPYYQGHFTNGPVWIEQLGIPNISNYAYNGATIDNDNLIAGYTQPNKTLVPGVRQQIVTYLANNDIRKVDLTRTLYVIWAGMNDYLDNSSITSDLVVTSLMNAVSDLTLVGAEHILVLNLPPLQAYPFSRETNKNLSLNTLVTNHNSYLLSNISQVNTMYNTTSIKVFDLYSLMISILTNNSIPAIDKTNPCWNISNDIVISQCLIPNQYIFIDTYHLTTTIHQRIAVNIQQFLRSSSSNFFISKLILFIHLFFYLRKKN
ncbi:unnamed protein product [Adineta steineri]|uniref:Uncharacterized protein n=1 Tax=Adineta steineri TaxID=433720 RepID=A0A815F887_9BILA|nr:unnamed protein product [Adineta steineri]CAF1489009.1 unnamed protein product [Adineta steineri]CAF1585160.1 unnamed protein product [Adineta steineri]CAF1640934.1 unnamed protein product [Adineta steineri]